MEMGFGVNRVSNLFSSPRFPSLRGVEGGVVLVVVVDHEPS